MTTYPTRARRWTRAEYDRLIETGVLQPGSPLELLGGELIVSEPQGSSHYTAVCLVEQAVRTAFGPGWVVRSQGPIALDDESEPEPDIAVVPGTPRDYSREHPARAVLVVEVAESSLRIDRVRKASFYARALIADYWILNLVDRVLEVYRDPVPDPTAVAGARYSSAIVLGPHESVAPLAAPGSVVRVSDALP